ncbi:MAG: hypothetical protein JW976_06135 [Syntrophaceae bacterium]|nr:hypothetical protein [Syntrophaceae bacterium]
MRQKIYPIIAVGLGVLISLVLAELTLRIFWPLWGYSFDKNEPVMHEFDPVLGWKNKPGHYIYPAYDGVGPDVRVIFLKDGSRATSGNVLREKNGKNIILVGCSYTEGWAVSDQETFAWKLQKKFPHLNFYNYGTAGYSTYQSLLLLQRVIPFFKKSTIVIYGFTVGHEDRNLARSDWLFIMSLVSQRGQVYLPYVTIDSEGTLIRHAPERSAMFPFRKQSALIAFSEMLYVRFKTRGRLEQRNQATLKLVMEMQKLVNSYGAMLIIVILDGTNERANFYQILLQKNGILCFDCRVPPTPDLLVPGEGHPNDRLHSLWADCISSRLQRLLH